MFFKYLFHLKIVYLYFTLQNLFEFIPNDLKCEMSVLKNMIKGVPNYLTIKKKYI
jgi:hypothetical protein